jgi:hypothetical protein
MAGLIFDGARHKKSQRFERRPLTLAYYGEQDANEEAIR